METLSALLFLSLSLFQYFSGVKSTSLTITNNCDDMIWPVVSPPPGPNDSPSGFSLAPGGTRTLTVASNWSGLAWARTHCSSDDLGCATGDERSGKPSPPATAAEFAGGGRYAVSVVDGYNLPVLVVPTSSGCPAAGCSIDYGGTAYYPPELRAGERNESKPTGIKSACTAIGGPEYCCSGTYASASACKPNSYSEFFKKLCPQARTYAFDDVGTVFTCESADFVVHFCSPPNYSGGRGTSNPGSSFPDDNSNINYGKKNVDAKLGIIIGVAVGILGTVLIWFIWRWCRKSECETCTFTCCSIFSCSCCPDSDHHGHSGKC